MDSLLCGPFEGKTPRLATSARLYRGPPRPLQRGLLARSSYARTDNCQCKHRRTELMRPSPAICHIGEVGAVVGAGRIAHARHLFPVSRINCGKIRLALGPGVNFGDFETVGNIHALL